MQFDTSGATEGGRSRFLSVAALALLVALVGMFAIACGDDDDDDTGDSGEATTEETANPTEDETGTGAATSTANGGEATAPADAGSLEFGYVAGWPEGVAVAFLWEQLLEERGYEVELTQLDIGVAFAGVADGDIDLYLDASLPRTHASYMEQFGDDLVKLSSWYGPADLFLTVPSYVDADSLDDLAAMADEFNSTITGIEAGAGMMGILRERVMPAYGLEDWTLTESSTAAMLAALDAAVANEEPIVVTLWTPGWWYDVYDLTNLEDPEGAWGETDDLWVVTRSTFADDFSQVTAWLENFYLEDPPLAALENEIREAEESGGDAAQGVADWLSDEENRQLTDSWFTGSG